MPYKLDKRFNAVHMTAKVAYAKREKQADPAGWLRPPLARLARRGSG